MIEDMAGKGQSVLGADRELACVFSVPRQAGSHTNRRSCVTQQTTFWCRLACVGAGAVLLVCCG